MGGNAVLVNQCHCDTWIWSSGGPAIKVPKRSIYKEPKRARAAGGVVIKVSKSPQLIEGQQTQFEYATHNNILYYDISFKACQFVRCKPNSYCPKQAYFVDTPLQKLNIPEPVYGCGTAGVDMDINFRMCADNGQIKKRQGQSVAGRIVVDRTEGEDVLDKD
ncbi:hypothetical protein K504DRAFT_477610 [Pleomassaria siparia CBS 279.74]|uniref:Uncharacterized protein n=1 Tax=Pleomassaria siparia CBS 279.74 TaxID=1314801 RepID=A0A6G1K5U5_9PLEO|nr:hypothetical protein K504DRAFT_477610 [Pleomassaria siparia CBS 279.74]